MRKIIPILLLVIILFFYTISINVYGQEYWIGLNFDLKFLSDGALIITIKMHPFKASGESLYKDNRIFNEIKNNERSQINDALLLVSTNPAKLKYEVIQHLKRDDNKIVLCDVYNKGVMEKLRGAYIITLKVYLNTSDLLERIDNNIYRITIIDSFTSRDPRSWIDVLNISFGEKVSLIKYEWIPSSSHGPSKTDKNYLLWINFNEPQAPNKYILTLSLPDFHYTSTYITTAFINSYNILKKDSEKVLSIVIKNNSTAPAYFIVRFLSNDIDMARKIFIDPGKTAKVSFTIPMNLKRGYVEVWFETTLLDKIEVKLGKGSIFNIKNFIQNKYMIFPIILLSMGIFLIILSILLKLFSRRKLEEPYSVIPQSPVESFQ